MVAFYQKGRGKTFLSEEPQLAPACSNYKDSLSFFFQSLGKLNGCQQTRSKNIRQISGLVPGVSELPAGDDKPGSDHSRSQVSCHGLQSTSNSEVLIKTWEQ